MKIVISRYLSPVVVSQRIDLFNLWRNQIVWFNYCRILLALWVILFNQFVQFCYMHRYHQLEENQTSLEVGIRVTLNIFYTGINFQGMTITFDLIYIYFTRLKLLKHVDYK